MGKKAYTSKTLWANIVGIIVILIQAQAGYVIDPVVQTGLLGLINIILRLITKEPIQWGKDSDNSGGSDGLNGLNGLNSFGMCLLVILLVSGCAYNIKNETREVSATKTMISMREAIVTIAATADQMCTQGTLNQDQCNKVAEMYRKAEVTYDFAADALAVALSGQNVESAKWSVYQSHHNAFVKLFADITNIAIEFRMIPAIEGGVR